MYGHIWFNCFVNTVENICKYLHMFHWLLFNISRKKTEMEVNGL